MAAAIEGNSPISLRRDCEVVQIPSGEKGRIPAGTWVTITQSLGGTYTVTTDQGTMVRIAGKDADALGFEVAAVPGSTAQPAPSRPEDVEKMVWDQLRTIYDPEIPASIVDLGLVYQCQVTPLPAGGNVVDIVMTLTAPGCGMGDVLKSDAMNKLLSLPGVKDAHVEVVVDPPWDPSMMSEAAKLQLGMM